MSRIALIQLVNSLSKSEKRHFKLSTKKQAGSKEYLDLFDLVEQENYLDITGLENEFKAKHPESSFDNTVRYLIKVLSDCLIQAKVKDDPEFSVLQGLMRVNILRERSLDKESFKELKKIKVVAEKSENIFMLPLINRYELNFLADLNFNGLCEKKLVEMQMKAKEIIKTMRNTHEHYSLYELLKFRMINSGKILSEEDKKNLNDLILGEMGLVTGRIKNNFDSKKIHLLFHSFFFTDIGDFKSALKTFYELNRLFEQNPSKWSNPPLDYLSSLDGILDSLRTIKSYPEMPFYMDKMMSLSNERYPDYFRTIIDLNLIIYQLAIFSGTGKFEEAVKFIHENNVMLTKVQMLTDYEKQCELFFYLALCFFGVKEFTKSQKYINNVVLIGKINYQSVIYKASRLLNMIIHYESKNYEYLDYEIRSYKRLFQNKGKLLQTEKVLFKMLQTNSAKVNEVTAAKLKPLLNGIENNKFEIQLQKYFDFTIWIRNKIEKSNSKLSFKKTTV
jgi:hypothetical protein